MPDSPPETPPAAPEDRSCHVCGTWVPAGGMCPRCRATQGKRRESSRAAWMMVGGGILVLVALYLWVNKLGGAPDEADDPTIADVTEPKFADGTATPGGPVPLPFGEETCIPWHVSAAEEPPEPGTPFLVLTSRVVDPGALVLSGFVSACGEGHPVLVLEDLTKDSISKAIAEQKPTGVLAVGMSAVKRAVQDLPGVPIYYAHVFNPVEMGLDTGDLDAVGVSPWVPAGPMVRHVLTVLPKNSPFKIIHAEGKLVDVVKQVTTLLREKKRDVELFPYPRGGDLDALLGAAATEGSSFVVLPDRDVIDLDAYNRIQNAAQKHAIPVAVPDEEHVRRGALVGVGPDSFRIGRQLCRLAGAHGRGKLPPDSRIFCPEYSFAALHQAVLEKLGYMLGPEHVLQAKLYKWH